MHVKGAQDVASVHGLQFAAGVPKIVPMKATEAAEVVGAAVTTHGHAHKVLHGVNHYPITIIHIRSTSFCHQPSLYTSCNVMLPSAAWDSSEHAPAHIAGIMTPFPNDRATPPSITAIIVSCASSYVSKMRRPL